MSIYSPFNNTLPNFQVMTKCLLLRQFAFNEQGLDMDVCLGWSVIYLCKLRARVYIKCGLAVMTLE